MTETYEAERKRIGPLPSDDPVERLRHVLHVFEFEDDAREVLTATRNVYGRGHWTGITLGDLREIARRIDALAPPRKLVGSDDA